MESRARTKNLVIRLHPEERDELAALAEAERLSASDVVRRLIRREFAALKPVPKKSARPKA
jgi:hypothetical protein